MGLILFFFLCGYAPILFTRYKDKFVFLQLAKELPKSCTQELWPSDVKRSKMLSRKPAAAFPAKNCEFPAFSHVKTNSNLLQLKHVPLKPALSMAVIDFSWLV